MRKIGFILIFFMMFCSLLSGYSLPESSASGECVGAVTGKYTALGGSVIMGENWTNPALLARGSGFRIKVGAGLLKSGEKRKKSIFDVFDNRVGDITVADNNYVFLEPTYLSLSYTSNFHFALGLNLLPVVNFDYRYSREVRDDFYVLVKSILDEGKGSLYLGNVGVAYEFFREKISVGLGVNLYTGEKEWEYGEDYVDPSYADINEVFSRTLSGNGVIVGISANPITRIRLGGFLSTKTNTGDYEEDYIPQRAGLGAAITLPNRLPATFFVDAIFEGWNEISDNYEDVLKLHLGIQHEFTSGFDGRFGFGYETSYLSKNVPRVFFTCGCGFEKAGYVFDTGIKLCKFSFRSDDISIEPRDMDGVTMVEESLIKLMFSIGYHR